MSLQSYLSRRNFKISTLDEIFSHFGPLCGGGTAQERTATGRRGSKHGWVVTPATVGRQARETLACLPTGRGGGCPLHQRHGGGEPRQRRTSSPFAVCGFFSPDNTRYEEAGPFCGSSARLATTSRPALTATRAREMLLPDWMLLIQKVSNLFEKVMAILLIHIDLFLDHGRKSYCIVKIKEMLSIKCQQFF